ncbi:uncharacterized protein ACA1_123640 [Acanthamoeba castellanii str. Neff]|uniref:Uncharacterized protein n=1 Tax=Acanthamoeba castellanii (strain ATCC 30010 / Neff) TaxID=1257118 RepID=L8HFA6_ACACF|nr:uncharacterized protein ACA1_123640 [Acanthamoeba castellanii str. Neff]ELR23855.1 hypothetical protein ACA1_123640 [Acanthamoeba castellanii str. Neff]
MEYEPVGVLSTEVERLKEGILAQLQALRWQVVDFTVSDALRAVSDAGGVVELRLQVSSDVWREKTNEAGREEQRATAKAEEEERAKREEAERVERQKQEQQRIAEAEERQRTLDKEENEEKMKEAELSAISIEEELRLRREWEAVKEKARRKVFDEVRREQDQRMLFALNLRESFGLKKTSEPRHREDYSLPFEMPTYADDPFPVGTIAPALPTIAASSSSSPFGSPRIAAEAVDTLPLARGAGQLQQQHGATSVRAIALHARKPARNWQAELRPGLVFVIDARLGNEVGPTTTTADSGLAEEWWIGRKFGDESGPRRAVPAGLVHVLHGDARLLRQQSLSDLLQQEGIDADREVMLPNAAPAQQDARHVLPRPAAAVVPAGAASESGEEQNRKNEAAEALKRESEREAEREKARLLAREEQERKAREAAEELRKRQAEEEARRKRQAEREGVHSMPPADHKDSADKSRTAITAGAYNMMPVPVMSSEIEAAIKERGRRKSANLGADVIADKPEASRQREMERDRRRSATAAVLMQQQQHQPLPQTASEGQLRPPPPSRTSRRSLDPSAAPLTAPPEAEGGSAPPPLPPLPSALPPPASAAALARDKRLSLPAHVLLKRNEEAIAAAAAAAGPPPALPPMPSGGIGLSSGQQTVSASALPTNPRTRAVPPASSASSDALSTRGDQRKSWAADDASAGPLASSASSVPTAAASLAKREALGIERQRSATVLGTAAAAAAAPQRTTSSSALLRAQTLRPSKSSSGGSSKDKLDKEEKKKDKEEKKKKKDEEKEKKRKEKEKKKEDKKKKKG